MSDLLPSTASNLDECSSSLLCELKVCGFNKVCISSEKPRLPSPLALGSAPPRESQSVPWKQSLPLTPFLVGWACSAPWSLSRSHSNQMLDPSRGSSWGSLMILTLSLRDNPHEDETQPLCETFVAQNNLFFLILSKTK